MSWAVLNRRNILQKRNIEGNSLEKIDVPGINELAISITAALRRGYWPFMAFGFIVGAGAGSALGFILFWWLFPGIALGGLTGATIAAVLFPAANPPKPLPGFADPSFSPGRINSTYYCDIQNINRMTVLMDRALYTAVSDRGSWDVVQDKLARGLDPEIPLQYFIPLDAVTQIRMFDDAYAEIECFYKKGASESSVYLCFLTHDEKSAFLSRFAYLSHCDLVSAHRADSFLRATWVPLLLLIVFIAFMTGAIVLSNYWTHNPPPPKAGTGKPDELAQFLVWLGPAGTAVAFSLPVLASLGWFLFRVIRPTISEVLTPTRRLAPSDGLPARLGIPSQN